MRFKYKYNHSAILLISGYTNKMIMNLCIELNLILKYWDIIIHTQGIYLLSIFSTNKWKEIAQGKFDQNAIANFTLYSFRLYLFEPVLF